MQNLFFLQLFTLSGAKTPESLQKGKRCGSAEVAQNIVIDVGACYQLGLMSTQLHKQEGLRVLGSSRKVLDHGTL